jgi:hypothetical protein
VLRGKLYATLIIIALKKITLPSLTEGGKGGGGLQSFWTPPGLDPGSTGVTTFYEIIIFKSEMYFYIVHHDEQYEKSLTFFIA